MKPNPKWNAMVMIVTPCLIVGLLQGGLYQRVLYLKKRLDYANILYKLPEFPYGETEVQKAEREVEKLVGEYQQRKELYNKAVQYGVRLPKGASLDVWKKIVEEEGVRDYLKRKNKALLQRYSLDPAQSTLDYEENLSIWFSALSNLKVVVVRDEYRSFQIMESEMTQSLSSILGFSPPKKQEEYNLPILVELEKSYSLANELSRLMQVEICYLDCTTPPCQSKKGCKGWRLPNKEEWLSARGDIDQKWSYMSWLDLQEGTFHAIAQKAPNNHGLYDVVGNVSEWVEEGVAMGGGYKNTLEEALSNVGKNQDKAGIRLINGHFGIQENEE